MTLRYAPDPAEEAWYASPAGLRAAARALRQQAADMLARAEAMDAEAKAKEAGK